VTINLESPEATKCGEESGEASDCVCPKEGYVCQETAHNQICAASAVEKTVCGTLDACCTRLALCGESEIECAPLTHSRTDAEYCPVSGCTEQSCCALTCLGFACEDKGFGKPKLHSIDLVCPVSGCDPDVCCEMLDPTREPNSPTGPTEAPTDFVECGECTTDGKNHPAVAIDMILHGLSPSGLLEHFEARASFFTAVQNSVAGLVPDDRVRAQLDPAGTSSSTKCTLLIMPPKEDLARLEGEMREHIEMGVLSKTVRDAVNSVPDVELITETGVVVVAGVTQPKVVTVVNPERIGDSISSDDGSIWSSHGWAMWTWVKEFTTAYWMILVAVGVLMVGSGAYFMYWLSQDEEERNVLG